MTISRTTRAAITPKIFTQPGRPAVHTEPDGDPDQALATLRQALAAHGYEPYDEPDGTIRLRNCPFDRIAAHHRELVCGANHAMLQALTDQVGATSRSGRCWTLSPGAAASR